VNERASESCAREFDKNPSAKYCDDQRFQILQALISLHCASAAVGAALLRQIHITALARLVA
jgi:hypothetical protein